MKGNVEMSKLQFSPSIVNESDVKGIWTKQRQIMLRADDGSLTKIGTHLDAVFESVEEGKGTDYVTVLEPADFSQRKLCIRYLFQDEMSNLKQETFSDLRNR